MERQGLVHIYYGDGKGKTTAAEGLAVRSAGAGHQVLFVQFLKDDSSSERRILENLPNVECWKGREREKFSFQMNQQEKEEAGVYYREKLNQVSQALSDYDLVVLDELICAVRVGFVKEEEVLSMLRNRPAGTELVLTGNVPSEELIGAADYVTEMKKIKHPYDKGIKARAGIEL